MRPKQDHQVNHTFQHLWAGIGTNYLTLAGNFQSEKYQRPAQSDPELGQYYSLYLAQRL